MSGGPYNLRSRPQGSDSAPPALSPEQFPPLTPTTMSAPSSSNDDIMDLLRSVAASQAATAAEVTSHSAQLAAMASTDARVERLEALVASLTTTRTGGGVVSSRDYAHAVCAAYTCSAFATADYSGDDCWSLSTGANAYSLFCCSL